MPNRKIIVTLDGRAKVDGERRQKGEQVEVTLATALQLVEAGALAAIPEVVLDPAAPGEDPTVHEKARAMAETIVGQKVAEALAETTSELENERRRNDDLSMQLAAVVTERDTLKAQLAAVTAPAADQDAAGLSGGEGDQTAPKKRGK